MKLKETTVKLCAVFLFGISAIGFVGSGANSAVVGDELKRNSFSCFFQESPATPNELFLQSADSRADSQLLARLFQIMFILFLISPPLIALLLFLIWQELKKRNELK